MSKKNIKNIVKFNFKTSDEFTNEIPINDNIKNKIILWCKDSFKKSSKYLNITVNKVFIENNQIVFEYFTDKDFKEFTSVREYLIDLHSLELNIIFENHREVYINIF